MIANFPDGTEVSSHEGEGLDDFCTRLFKEVAPTYPGKLIITENGVVVMELNCYPPFILP